MFNVISFLGCCTVSRSLFKCTQICNIDHVTCFVQKVMWSNTNHQFLHRSCITSGTIYTSVSCTGISLDGL